MKKRNERIGGKRKGKSSSEERNLSDSQGFMLQDDIEGDEVRDKIMIYLDDDESTITESAHMKRATLVKN